MQKSYLVSNPEDATVRGILCNNPSRLTITWDSRSGLAWSLSNILLSVIWFRRSWSFVFLFFLLLNRSLVLYFTWCLPFCIIPWSLFVISAGVIFILIWYFIYISIYMFSLIIIKFRTFLQVFVVWCFLIQYSSSLRSASFYQSSPVNLFVFCHSRIGFLRLLPLIPLFVISRRFACDSLSTIVVCMMFLNVSYTSCMMDGRSLRILFLTYPVHAHFLFY